MRKELEIARFLNSDVNQEASNVVLFGVPIGRSFASVSQAFRETPTYLETFDIDAKKDLLKDVKIADAGDLSIKSPGEITQYTRSLVADGKIPLAISGDHPSLFTIPAFEGAVKVISFDAHCDLKDEYSDNNVIDLSTRWDGTFDARVNGATWLRRLTETMDPKNILLLGVRSCDAEELRFIEENGMAYATAEDTQNKREAVKEKIREFSRNSQVYITLDVDVFDPSIAPAVHHPEPNGISFCEFKDMVHSISGAIKGFDVCCLKPIEGNKVTEFLAIRSLFEILGLLKV